MKDPNIKALKRWEFINQGLRLGLFSLFHMVSLQHCVFCHSALESMILERGSVGVGSVSP